MDENKSQVLYHALGIEGDIADVKAFKSAHAQLRRRGVPLGLRSGKNGRKIVSLFYLRDPFWSSLLQILWKSTMV